MKAILKHTTILACTVLLLGSCNSLDQEPTNKYTDKVFWTSPERANLVLNMA